MQASPSHAIPSQAPAVPQPLRFRSDSDDSVFTPADWENVLKGYRSQYVEHEFWVDPSMIEGEALMSYCILPASILTM